MPGNARRCHEVIHTQCMDDDTEQARLLGVPRGGVSAVKSAAPIRRSQNLKGVFQIEENHKGAGVVSVVVIPDIWVKQNK